MGDQQDGRIEKIDAKNKKKEREKKKSCRMKSNRLNVNEV
jgi:hypothetical protein